MRLSTKIAYNTAIQILSKGLSTLLALAAVAIITRYLGQNGFGQYTTILTFLSFFAIIADLGLTLVTVQIISQPACDEKKAISNLLGLRAVSALIFLGLAPALVLFFPYAQEIKTGVAITAISFFFIAMNQIFVGLFQKNLRMDKPSLAEIVSRVALLIGIILAFRLDWGLYGVLAVTVISGFISFAFHFAFARRFCDFGLEFNLVYWKMILKKSWPLAITIALNLIYLKSDTLFLSFIPRESEIGIIAEVGIYGAAYKVIDVLITLPFMFSGLILPILTARWAKNDSNGFREIMQKGFDALAVFALPICIGTQFIAGKTMITIAGPDFMISGQVLRILILAAGAIFLGNIFSHAIIAINKQKNIIPAYIFVALSSVIGYFLVIPVFSYTGAAWITVYSETAIALAAYYIIWKHARFIPNFAVFFKCLLAAVLMAAALWIFQSFNRDSLILSLFLAGATYFSFLYLFKTFRKEDVLELLNKTN